MRNFKQWGKRVTSLVLAASMMFSIASPVVVALEPTDDHYEELLAAQSLLDAHDHEHGHDESTEPRTGAYSATGLSAVSADDYGIETYGLCFHSRNNYKWQKGLGEGATCTKDSKEWYMCPKCKNLEDRPGGDKALGHEKAEGTDPVKTDAATCVSEGKAYYHCTRCKDSEGYYEEKIPIDKTAHTWDSGKVTTPATCKEDGVKTYTCTNTTAGGVLGLGATKCNETRTEPIKAVGGEHEWEWTIEGEPTCLEDITMVQVCQKCNCTGETKTETAKGHHYVEKRTEPTCQKDGEVKYVCDNQVPIVAPIIGTVIGYKDCGDVDASRTETLPKGDAYHNWGTKTGAPTCTENGKTWEECSDCGATRNEKETDAALGHQMEMVVTKAATCTEEGTKTNTCTRVTGKGVLGQDKTCGYTDDTTEPIEPKGHNYKSTVSSNFGRDDIAPTCSTPGKKYVICSNNNGLLDALNTCTETLEVAVPCVDHNWVLNEAESTAPTCTEHGVNVYNCSYADCSVKRKTETYPEVEELKATGHKWGETIVGKNPTCKETGAGTHTCTVEGCGVTEGVTIDKLPHAVELGEGTPATCYSTGQGAYSYCKDCGTIIVPGRILPMLAHTPSEEYNVFEAPTCEKEGYKAQYCSVCLAAKKGYVEIEGTKVELPATGHDKADDLEWTVKTPATCTSAGVEVKVCHCGVEVASQPIAAGNGAHNWSNEVTVKAPTCTESGYSYYKCLNSGCNAEDVIEGSEVKALDHDWLLTDSKDVTCTEDGYKTYVCKREGCKDAETGKPATKTDTTTKLDHNWSDWSPKQEHKCQTVKQTRTCQREGCVDADGKQTTQTQTAEATDKHVPGDWTVKTPATCCFDGEEVQYCKTCNTQCNTRKIPKSTVAHTYGEWVEVKAPTCEENGERYRTCKIEGCVHKDIDTTSDEMKALGHSFTNYVADSKKACQEQTATATCDNTGCGKTDTKVTGLAPESHKFYTYVEDGDYYISYCENCGEKDEHKKVFAVTSVQKYLADRVDGVLKDAEALLAEAQKDPYSVTTEDVKEIQSKLSSMDTLTGNASLNKYGLGPWEAGLMARKAAVNAGIEELNKFIEINQTIYTAKEAIDAAEDALKKLDAATVTIDQATELNNLITAADTALASVTDEAKKAELKSRLDGIRASAKELTESAATNTLNKAKTEATAAVEAAEAKYNELKNKEGVTTAEVEELKKLIEEANGKLETLRALDAAAWATLATKLDGATSNLSALEGIAAVNDAYSALAAAQAEYNKLESEDITYLAGFTTAFNTFNNLMDKVDEAIKKITDEVIKNELTAQAAELQAKADKLFDDTQAADVLKYVAGAEADLKKQQDKLVAGTLTSGDISGILNSLGSTGNYALAWGAVNALKLLNSDNPNLPEAEARLKAVEAGYNALDAALSNQTALKNAQTAVKNARTQYDELMKQNVTDENNDAVIAMQTTLTGLAETLEALPEPNEDTEAGYLDGTILKDGNVSKTTLQTELKTLNEAFDSIGGVIVYNAAVEKANKAVADYKALMEKMEKDASTVTAEEIKNAQDAVSAANAAINIVADETKKAELNNIMAAVDAAKLTELNNYVAARAKVDAAEAEYEKLAESNIEDLAASWKDSIGDAVNALLGKGPFASYEKASKAAYEAIEAVADTGRKNELKTRMDAVEAKVAKLKEDVKNYQLASATKAVENVEAELKTLQDKLVAGTLTTAEEITGAAIWFSIASAQSKISDLPKGDAKDALQKRLDAVSAGTTALTGALVNRGLVETADTAVKAAEKQYKEIYANLDKIEDISTIDTKLMVDLITAAETAINQVPEPNADLEAGLLDGTIVKNGDTYTSKTTLEERLQKVKDGTAGLTDAYYIKRAESQLTTAEDQLKSLQDKQAAGNLSELELAAGLTALKLAYSTAKTSVEKISESNETRKAMDKRLEDVAKGIEALEADQNVLLAKAAVKLAVEMYENINKDGVSDTLLNQLVEAYDAAKKMVDALPDSEAKTELQAELAQIADGIETLREQLAVKKATELVKKVEDAVAAVDISASTMAFITAMTSAQDKYEEAQTAVSELPDSEAKTALEERLEAVSKQIATKWGEFIKSQMADLWDQIKNGELDTSALESLKKALEDLKGLSDIPIIGGIVGSTIDEEIIDELIAMIDVALGSANLFNHAKKVINQLFDEIKAGDVTQETLNEAKAVLKELGDLIKNTVTNDVLQNMAKKLFDQISNAIEEAAAQAAIKALQAIINENTYDGFAKAYHAVIDALNKLPDGSFKDGLIKQLEDLKDKVKDAVTQQLNAILLDDTLSFEEKDARIAQIEEEYDEFFQYIGLSGEFDKLIATIRTQMARLYINALKGIIANMADQNEIDAAYEAAVKAIEVLGKYGFVDTEALLKELLEVLKEDIYDDLMEGLSQILYDDVATYEEKIEALKQFAKEHSDVLNKIGDLIDIDGWIQTILNEEMVKIIENAVKEIADIVNNDELDALGKIDALNALKNKIHGQVSGVVGEDVAAALDKFDKKIQNAIDSIAKAAGWATDKILDAALAEVNKAVQEAESKEDLMAKINKIYADAHALLVKLGQTEAQATDALKELKDIIDTIEETLYYDKIDFIAWKTLQNTLGTLLDSMIESDEPATFVINVVSDILTGNSGNLDKDGKIFALAMVRDIMEDADWQLIAHNLVDDAMGEALNQIEGSQYAQYEIVQDLLDRLMDEMGILAKEDLDEATIQKISQIFVDMLNNAIENVENDADYETIMRKARADLSGLSGTVTGEVTRIGNDASKLVGVKVGDVLNDRIPGGFLTNWIGKLAGSVTEIVVNKEIEKYNKEIGKTITSYVKRYTCWKHNLELVMVTEPTCETTGLKVTMCRNCDWVEDDKPTEIIPALGHVAVTDAAVEPTQTSYGYTEGSHCARCGKTLVAQHLISMLDPDIDTRFERAPITAQMIKAAGFVSEAELNAAIDAALTAAGYNAANSERFQICVNSSIGVLPSNRFPADGVKGTLSLPAQTAGKMAQIYYAVQVFTADTIGHKAGDIVVTPITLLNSGKNGMELTVYTEAIVVIAWKTAQ